MQVTEIMKYVSGGGREQILFVPGKEPGDTEIQKEFAEIIKQGECVLR